MAGSVFTHRDGWGCQPAQGVCKGPWSQIGQECRYCRRWRSPGERWSARRFQWLVGLTLFVLPALVWSTWKSGWPGQMLVVTGWLALVTRAGIAAVAAYDRSVQRRAETARRKAAAALPADVVTADAMGLPWPGHNSIDPLTGQRPVVTEGELA